MPVRHRHGGKATAGPTPAAAASSVRDTFPEFPTHWFVEEPVDGWESAKVYPHHLWGWRSDLDMAARLGDVETVRTIAETRPRREVQDFLEMRMLLTAVAEQGHLVMCAVLIDELGCFVDGVRDMRNRPDWHQVQAVSGNSGNGLGLTPLFRAVIVGHSRVVSLLIKRGANPNHAAENGGGTALHFAIAQRHVRCVAALLGCGKTNLSAKGPDGRTPRQLAEALVEGTSAPTCVPASGEVDPAQRKSAPSGKPGCGDTQNREGAQKIADMRASVIAALLRGEAIRGVGGRDACIKCGSEAQPLMCNCGLVHYCGDRCQESHWDTHGEEHEEMMRRDERFTRIWRAGTRAQILWYLVSKGTKVLLSVLVPLIAQLFLIFFAAYFRFLTVSSAFSAVPVLACVPRNQRPNTLLPTHITFCILSLGAGGTLRNYEATSAWCERRLGFFLPPLQTLFPFNRLLAVGRTV